MQKQFKKGNYSRAETIWGNTVLLSIWHFLKIWLSNFGFNSCNLAPIENLPIQPKPIWPCPRWWDFCWCWLLLLIECLWHQWILPFLILLNPPEKSCWPEKADGKKWKCVFFQTFFFLWSRKTLKIRGWRLRICKAFEIPRTIYLNSEQ